MRGDVDALTAEFADRAPVRRTATFFIVTLSLFVVMWGGLSAASILGATTPDPVVHLVVALDGAVLLPLPKRSASTTRPRAEGPTEGPEPRLT